MNGIVIGTVIVLKTVWIIVIFVLVVMDVIATELLSYFEKFTS